MKDPNIKNQYDLESRTRYLKSMILVIIPLVIIVGLIGVPYFSGIKPYWQSPTVIPATSFLIISILSYVLITHGRYQLAVNLYVYIFLFAPFIAASRNAVANPGLYGLMVGGIIVASVMLRTRIAVFISALVAIVAMLVVFIFFPTTDNTAMFISLSVVATLAALVLIFKAINDKIEMDRRQKLEEVNETLSKQNRVLKKINDELDSFIYSISHDVRAPLSSIMGLVDLYKNEENPAIKDSYISHIATSTSKLEEYIFSIVDFARNTKTELKPVTVNMPKLLRNIYSQLEYINPSREITFEIVTNGIDEIVTDQERLGIILRNVISNSIKYSRQQENSFIKCEIDRNGSRNIIRISDNGMGIKEAHLSKVFDMFYRGTEMSDGSGLGLYIARETAEMLGGQITISSKYEEGTKVTLDIPESVE